MTNRPRTRPPTEPWPHFVAWCRARGLRPLPAHPWTVAAYARWCETRHRYPTIAARIKAIARVHLLKCANVPDRHPTVVGTLELIEARADARPSRAALFVADPIEGDEARAAGAKAKDADDDGKSKRRRTALTMRKAPPLVAKRPLRQ